MVYWKKRSNRFIPSKEDILEYSRLAFRDLLDEEDEEADIGADHHLPEADLFPAVLLVISELNNRGLGKHIDPPTRSVVKDVAKELKLPPNEFGVQDLSKIMIKLLSQHQNDGILEHIRQPHVVVCTILTAVTVSLFLMKK